MTIVRDNYGRISKIIDPDNNPIIYSYDANGDLVSVEDRDDNTTKLAYDAPQPHYLTQITDAMGDAVMAATYDTSGRLKQVTNATGESATLSYQAAALSGTTMAPGDANPIANTYNSMGQLTRSFDANGIETDYYYDINNYLIKKVTDSAHQDLVTIYTNNAYGEPLTETDPSGNVIRYTYDQYGATTYEADGDAVTQYNYYLNPDDPTDPQNGNLTWTEDSLGSMTTFTYDTAGDVLTTTTAAGTPGATTTTDTYYPDGEVKTTTNPQGVTTSYTYDNDGNQLTSTWTWINPNDASDTHTLITKNIYDGNGNLIETDQYDNGTLLTKATTSYDADGRAYSSTDALGGVTTKVYDADGNVIQTTSPAGLVTDTVYDSQGRAIYTDDPHKPGAPCDGTQTVYDQDGNVVSTERLADLVISVTLEGGDLGASALIPGYSMLSTSTTMYDTAGRIYETIDAAGLQTNYHYNATGNVSETDEMVNGVTRTTTSTYNLQGLVMTTTDALGHTTQYQYNTADQVTTTTFLADNSSIVDKYDSQGNKIAEIDQDGNETDYQYDQFGQLTAVMEPAVLDSDPSSATYGKMVHPTYQYAYDIYGNLTSVTDAKGRVTTYTYDQFGRKLTEALPMGGTHGTESWTYNSLGQMTSFNGLRRQRNRLHLLHARHGDDRRCPGPARAGDDLRRR